MLGTIHQPKSNLHKHVTSTVTKTVSPSQFCTCHGGFYPPPPNDVIIKFCNNTKGLLADALKDLNVIID